MAEDSDVDLEEGELVSSDDEDKKESPGSDQVNKDTSPPIKSPSTTTSEPVQERDSHSFQTQYDTVDPVSDDGEIYSDDEESAYFPNQVKSRPSKQPKEQDTFKKKRVSRWSDSYQSSPVRSRGYGSNKNQGPPDTRDYMRGDSPDKELFFKDREGSEDGMNEWRSSRENSQNDRHSSPDSKHGFYSNDRDSPDPTRQKWASRRGGYGSLASPYQSQGRYGGRGRGGGHAQKRFQPHTAMSEKDIRILSLQVPQRLEKGQSLLPDPTYATRQPRVDLSVYPPPPTWYLRELKAWDLMHPIKSQPSSSVSPSTSSTVTVSASGDGTGTELSTVTAVTATTANTSALLPTPNLAPIPITPAPVPLMSSLVPSMNNSAPSGLNPPTEVSVSNEETPLSDLTPLDPSMPFAEPLPSSSVPFAQPLLSTFQSQAQSDSRTDSQNQSVPESTNESTAEANMEMENSLRLDVVNVGETEQSANENSSLFARSFSVSSEVNMEIDLRNDQLGSATPTTPILASPTFKPPSQPVDKTTSPCKDTPALMPMGDQQTTPSQPDNQTEPAPEMPENENLTFKPSSRPATETTPPREATPPLIPTEDQQVTSSQPDHLPESAPPEMPETEDLSRSNIPVEHESASLLSAAAVSATEGRGLVSSCNLKNDSEVSKYNLRSRLESQTSNASVMDVSDEELDYDTYLDQLDDEEEVPFAPAITSSLGLSSLLQDGLPKVEDEGVSEDPFNEEFPVISADTAPSMPSKEESLMALVGGVTVVEKKERLDPGAKSSKKIEKALTWKAKQKLRKAATKDKATSQAPSPRPLCKYFMNGTCKNGDKCSFSHEGQRVKKKEVCKYYKQDMCNKGDNCQYYHGAFPCKFYHIRQYCRNGDSCKFSHAPLNPETEALLATVSGSVTPPAITPTLFSPSAGDKVQISGDGVQIKMFGSAEQNDASPFVVSIPRPEKLIVSIPLTKIHDKMKFGRIPKKHQQPAPYPVAQAPLTATPTPLFPDASLGEQTKGQPQNPPRPALLPTPPPHTKLTPEDFKRMKNMPHEYWEAPGLSEPHPQPQPPPPQPYRRPPYEQAFRGQAPYPSRHKQPFYCPPGPPRPPEQNWNQSPPHNAWPTEPGPPQSEPGPGAWNQRPNYAAQTEPRPAGMDPRPTGIEQRPGRMDPRHSSNDPRHPVNNPRFSNQNDPRGSPAGSYHHGMKWGQSDQRNLQSSPPHSAQLSPPASYEKPSPGWPDKMSPARASWSSSPDHFSSNKGPADATSKRVDPRKKYSHLKIKSKNSPSQSSSLKKDNSAEPGYKIPKLLTDSTSLDKPIDPKELFGGEGMDSQPYGEITFGTYKSPFSCSDSISEKTESTQNSSSHQAPSNAQNIEDEGRTTQPSGQEVVPSYFAQIDSELGGSGLEIESAFGSLSEKGKDSEGAKSQTSQARKLPSVFGYGL